MNNKLVLVVSLLIAQNVSAAKATPHTKPLTQRQAYENFMEGTLKSARTYLQSKNPGAAHVCLDGAQNMLTKFGKDYVSLGGKNQSLLNWQIRVNFLVGQTIKQ